MIKKIQNTFVLRKFHVYTFMETYLLAQVDRDASHCFIGNPNAMPSILHNSTTIQLDF